MAKELTDEEYEKMLQKVNIKRHGINPFERPSVNKAIKKNKRKK